MQGCRFIGNFEVVHYDCPDYKDGIITRVTDGKIVAQMIDGKRVERD